VSFKRPQVDFILYPQPPFRVRQSSRPDESLRSIHTSRNLGTRTAGCRHPSTQIWRVSSRKSSEASRRIARLDAYSYLDMFHPDLAKTHNISTVVVWHICKVRKATRTLPAFRMVECQVGCWIVKSLVGKANIERRKVWRRSCMVIP
jgi:hypothetical protein